MLAYFVVGILLGAGLVWLLYFSARREIVRIEEEKQLLQQERHTVIEFMHQLVEAIGEGVEKDALYQRIVHAAILSSGALSACLFEKGEDKTLRGVAVEGLFPPLRPVKHLKDEFSSKKTRAQFIQKVLRSETYEAGEGLVGTVANQQKAMIIKNAAKDPRIAKHKDDSLKISSIILAPILFRKKTLGVLAVANPSDGMAFTQSDLSLVESLAEQAGMAINNANLMKLLIEKNKMDFDLSLASNIQGMLLPSNFPENGTLDIGAYYQPAQKVGGDLYDIFELPNKKIGVAIADVSGKGIPASILMAICQTNLRHFARQLESPAEVLKAMNKEMLPETRQDMFVTMIYAIVDTKNENITMARAGHELPLLLRLNEKTGKLGCIKVKSEGMALGMVNSDIFDEIVKDRSIRFRPKDTLILYTDGITEAYNDKGEEFSFRRLSKTALASQEKTARAINADIVEAIQKYTKNSSNADDLTLLTIKHI